MSQNSVVYFRSHLKHWHLEENKRELPWKGEANVYRIWVSEIILQQTRAEQGKFYYQRFLERFPSLQSLAKAKIEEIYKVWEGLGYYNRARNMLHTACRIMDDFNGQFPSDYEALLSLKGIGPYTAAAIASFGFRLPYAVLDGNVFRVLSRYFGEERAIDDPKEKKWYATMAQQCLEKKRPDLYNQAIMDLGATICKPENPSCPICPLRRKCIALRENKVSILPVTSKKKTQKERYFIFHLYIYRNKIAIEQRQEKDIWKGLYQFPMIEISNKKIFDEQEGILVSETRKQKIKPVLLHEVRQQLTHQQIRAKGFVYFVETTNQKPQRSRWVALEKLDEWPMPRLLHLLREKLQVHIPEPRVRSSKKN